MRISDRRPRNPDQDKRSSYVLLAVRDWALAAFLAQLDLEPDVFVVEVPGEAPYLILLPRLAKLGQLSASETWRDVLLFGEVIGHGLDLGPLARIRSRARSIDWGGPP